jgi:hypothetical protein
MINENIVYNYFFEKALEIHNNQNCLLEISVGDPDPQIRDPDPQIRDPDPRIFTGIQIRKRSAIIFMRISYLRILNIPSKYGSP